MHGTPVSGPYTATLWPTGLRWDSGSRLHMGFCSSGGFHRMAGCVICRMARARLSQVIQATGEVVPHGTSSGHVVSDETKLSKAGAVPSGRFCVSGDTRRPGECRRHDWQVELNVLSTDGTGQGIFPIHWQNMWPDLDSPSECRKYPVLQLSSSMPHNSLIIAVGGFDNTPVSCNPENDLVSTPLVEGRHLV